PSRVRPACPRVRCSCASEPGSLTRRRAPGSRTDEGGLAMIKLYGVPGSGRMPSLWLLGELGGPYGYVKRDVFEGTHQAELQKINPNAQMHALQDGDLVLWESLAINLYLARKYDKGLWPKTVEDEGRAYQWSVWAMTELEEPVLTALLHRTFFPPEQRDAKK